MQFKVGFIRMLVLLIVVTGFIIQRNDSCAQNVKGADLDFSIPSDFFADRSVYLGLQAHPNEMQLVEGLSIKDYILTYHKSDSIHDFYFEESDSAIDKIVTQSISGQRAVFNIGFWGMSPFEYDDNFAFTANYFHDSPSVITFMGDLATAQYAKDRNQGLKDKKLVVVRLKAKDEETNDFLFYTSLRERLRLQSRYLFLFWDTSVKSKLPDMLRNAEMITYPFDMNTFFNYYLAHPLRFSSDEIKNLAPDIFAHINFVGNFDSTLSLTYEIYNLSGSKEENGETQAAEGIDVLLNMPSFDLLPGEGVKLIINKPIGLNITKMGEAPGLNWNDRTLNLFIQKHGYIDLNLSAIPNCHIFYLDVSSLVNRRAVIKAMNTEVKALLGKNQNVIIFLSNGHQPHLAEKNPEYSKVIGAANTSMPDPPNVAYDVKWLSENLDWDQIFRNNREVYMHYYIPATLYTLFHQDLIENFTFGLRNMQWKVYINTDKDVKKMGESRNKYYYNTID